MVKVKKSNFDLSKILFVALMLATLALAIFFLELFLQVREYQRHVEKLERSDVFELSPFLQIKPRVNPDLKINEDTFRGEPVSPDPDTFRIFTLGGSTTFESDLDFEETYPRLLEKKLREKYPHLKIQVQNAACDWYSTQHSIIRFLFKVRHYEPDLVIVKHAINDMFRSFVPSAWSAPGAVYRRDYSHYLGAIVNIVKNRSYMPFTQFLIWEKIKYHIFRIKPKPWDLNPEMAEFVQIVKDTAKPAKVKNFRSLNVFEGNLRILGDSIRAQGARAIFLTEPNIYHPNLTPDEKATLYFGPVHMREKGIYPDLESLEYGMRLYNDTIIRIGQELNIPVIDVEKSVPKDSQHFVDDVHPTAEATVIVAEKVFEETVRLGIIEDWEKEKLLIKAKKETTVVPFGSRQM